ncbi:MAG: trypsin-like serine protease [Bacteroidales bacterium]|nr:trypsin-like serine protease [Bacteroidales bacterium]
MHKILILIISSLCLCLNLSAQINQGGIPPGFSIPITKNAIPIINLEKPVHKIAQAKSTSISETKPMQFGVSIATDIDIVKKGHWERLPNGDEICRLMIKSAEANALGLYFDVYNLPVGAKLYLYDTSFHQITGAFTQDNNATSGLFATAPIAGEALIIEYYQPKYVKESPSLHIDEVLYAYKGFKNEDNIGDSDFCEVNVNCPEGEEVQDQKRGVCRIQIKSNNGYFWCSGSLVNNTKNDNSPYVLTADHCSEGASADDLQQWIFYFNYESPNCENPPNGSPESDYNYQSMTGAEFLARGGNSGQSCSDFYLVKLNESIPEDYYPYFNGWDITGSVYDTGYCIHHPVGDLKKLSFFNTPIVSTSYWSNSNPSHWRMYWSGSETNFGVTEPGSSGSPLFNQDGLIIGTLTGGTASCGAPHNPDSFGKMSYHWTKNGEAPDDQLAPWLDPLNLGKTKHYGISMGIPRVQANFSADTVIPVDSYIDFSNQSFGGNINKWIWEFEGGEPSTSTVENPIGIKYSSYGTFDVKLIIEGEFNTDTLIRKDYIKVVGRIFPNPTRDVMNIRLGKGNYSQLDIWIYDQVGALIKTQNIEKESIDGNFVIPVSELTTGFYIIQIQPTYFRDSNENNEEKDFFEGTRSNYSFIKL